MAISGQAPLSSVTLEDTVANFPALRHKFSREGLDATGKIITCPLSGVELSSGDAFILDGDYGFIRNGVISISDELGKGFTNNDMLFVVNQDIASNSTGKTVFGGSSYPEVIVTPPASYVYYNYTNYAAYGLTTVSGNLSCMGMAVSPQLEFGNKFAVYADGTTATEKDAGSVTGTIDQASWTIPAEFTLAASPTVYYSIYVLEFENGLPSDGVINQGLEWMSVNRDKGLPPMWKDLA